MKSFSGVLLKPIDQQADLDGSFIDPTGVSFDPDEWVSIWRNFNYNIPDDWVGRGKVSRETDGSLIVTGELVDNGPILPDKESPWKLAIGVVADKFEKPGVTKDCRLMSIAFTTEHADPTQPSIVIGATINRRDPVNLTRMGHYHTPSGSGEQGHCQWATVIKVVEQDPLRAVVNLKVIDGDGDEDRRLNVQQDDPYKGIERGEATFHLSTECPFGK